MFAFNLLLAPGPYERPSTSSSTSGQHRREAAHPARLPDDRFEAALADAFDDHRLQNNGLVRLVLAIPRDFGYLDYDILAFDDFAEDGVLSGEPVSWRHCEEELAAVRVGTAVGHSQFSGLVELVRCAHGFILKAVAGATHAGARGIAPLDHEVGNDAVEDGSVVELAGGFGACGRVGPLLGAL